MYDNIFYCKCRAAKAIESVLVCPLWASAFSWLSNINNKKISAWKQSCRFWSLSKWRGSIIQQVFCHLCKLCLPVWTNSFVSYFRTDGSVHLVSFTSVQPVHGLLSTQPSLCVFACSQVNWWLCSKWKWTNPTGPNEWQ